MASKSPIEWTDATWTPIRARVRQDAAAIAESKGYASLVNIASKMAGHVGPHCEHVSPGCDNCYSETGNCRCLPVNGTGLPFDRRARDLVEPFVDEKILLQPLHWRKPRKIFVCSQTDLFGEWVTDEAIDRVFAVMALCPQHTFQVLTKRARRMRKYLGPDPGDRFYNDNAAPARIMAAMNVGAAALRWPLPNVWLGVSVEDQQRADERTPELLQTPAAVRFLSVEPLLGPVDLREIAVNMAETIRECVAMRQARGEIVTPESIANYPPAMPMDSLTGWSPSGNLGSHLDWVIVGGESGPGARPMHPDWARSLRDQCVAAGVPFFFKQWGEWQNGSAEDPSRDRIVLNDGRMYRQISGEVDLETRRRWPEFASCMMTRVRKKTAGRLLDGCEWNEMPEFPRA